jgi:glycosyltransferase involved in cell wall biosynthesis
MSSYKTITAFLGIYNGEKYLDSLFDQIKNQDSNEFNLLVVDNASTDNSAEIIKTWPQKLSDLNVQIIINPNNLGAGGSLNHNLHLINTPWFLTMHQDDFYKPNHVSALTELIKKAGDDVSGASTTMGSTTNEGKKIKSIPRSTWFSSDMDNYGQFIQNIKSQSIPFPCTAFKTELYKKTQVLIHNPSFSDSEQTLKMLCYGRFLISNNETMLYRENNLSESHSLNRIEREIGAYIGLNRVFASEIFLNLIKPLGKEEVFSFINKLSEAVTHRITDSKLQKITQISLIENFLDADGYDNKKILQLLSAKYEDFSSQQTLNNLGNLGNFSTNYRQIEKEVSNHHSNWKRKLWGMYFNSRIPIPHKIHKKIIISAYKLLFKIKPTHRWNNK